LLGLFLYTSSPRKRLLDYFKQLEVENTEKTIQMAALLHRYYHQLLSEEEEQQLQQWLASQPEGYERLERIRRALQKKHLDTTIYDLGTERALQQVKKRLHQHPTPLYRRFYPYAAAIILLIIGGFLFQTRYGQTSLETTYAQTKEVYLADGTYVKLEPCSKLTYSKNIGRGNRTVNLEGGAYFHVAENKAHPFTIRNHRVKVEVLGTSFRFKSYAADNEASVLVTSGKVRVSDAQAASATTMLTYGEKAVFTKNKDLKTQAINQQDLDKIAAGIVVYRGEPLQHVIADLERSYNVRINCQEGLKSRLFFGELDPQDKLPLFLKKLTMTVHATWKQTSNNQYIIQKINNNMP